MSTTTLTTTASTYGVFVRYAYFHLRSSTATTGSTWEGHGEWHIERGGSIIHSAYNTMNFGWIGEDGDTLHVRYVDKAGNAGSFVTYDFVCGSAYDYVQYVDTGGNNANDGLTSGAPVQTIAQAKTNMAANLGAGEEGCIYIKRGQTHNISASAWSGNSTLRRVSFRTWSTGTRPIINCTSDVTAFEAGLSGGIVVDDIDVTGFGSGFGGGLVLQRSGAGTRGSWDIIVRDSTFQGFFYCVSISDDTWTGANRGTIGDDLVAFESVIFDDQTQYHIYSSQAFERVLFRDCTFGSNNGYTNPCRMFCAGDIYFEGLTVDTGDGGSIRLAGTGGDPQSAATRYVTFNDVNFIGGNPAVPAAIVLQGSTGDAGVNYIHDIRLNAVRFVKAGFGIGGATSPDCAPDIKRVQIWNCWGTHSPGVNSQSSLSLTMEDIEFRNCTWSYWEYAGGPILLTLGGGVTTSNLPAGAITMTGCVGYFPITGSSEPRYGIRALTLTTSELQGRFAACDYNHIGKVDGNGFAGWAESSAGAVSLATWDDSGLDTHSTITTTSDFDLTDDGEPDPETLNARLSATGGALDNTGYPRTYSIDADGYLRNASTPDAGAFEYGATATPDQPSLGGPSGSAAVFFGCFGGIIGGRLTT